MLFGPDDCEWEGYILALHIEFDEGYPFVPAKVCWHWLLALTAAQATALLIHAKAHAHSQHMSTHRSPSLSHALSFTRMLMPVVVCQHQHGSKRLVGRRR